jgi:hypothetical protein
MRLPNEPKGWRKLQRMAQRENDPQKLASIIARMNRLLDQHEKKAATQTPDQVVAMGMSGDESPQLSLQTWQLEA